MKHCYFECIEITINEERHEHFTAESGNTLFGRPSDFWWSEMHRKFWAKGSWLFANI